MSGPYRHYDPGPLPLPGPSTGWTKFWAAVSWTFSMLTCWVAFDIRSTCQAPNDPVEAHCTRICEVVGLEYMTGWESDGGPGPATGAACVCGDRNAIMHIWPDGDSRTTVIRAE